MYSKMKICMNNTRILPVLGIFNKFIFAFNLPIRKHWFLYFCFLFSINRPYAIYINRFINGQLSKAFLQQQKKYYKNSPLQPNCLHKHAQKFALIKKKQWHRHCTVVEFWWNLKTTVRISKYRAGRDLACVYGARWINTELEMRLSRSTQPVHLQWYPNALLEIFYTF